MSNVDHTDDIPQRYNLENIEQMRVLADDRRIRILDILSLHALTVTELGGVLNIVPAKAHYHVRELERVGLVRLVETREKGGILEKLYRAVAKEISIPSELLRSTPPDETLQAAREMLDTVTNGFLKSLAHEIGKAQAQEQAEMDKTSIGLTGVTLWLTTEEGKALFEQVNKLLEPYVAPRGVEGERERMFVQLAYNTNETANDDGDI